MVRPAIFACWLRQDPATLRHSRPLIIRSLHRSPTMRRPAVSVRRHYSSPSTKVNPDWQFSTDRRKAKRLRRTGSGAR